MLGKSTTTFIRWFTYLLIASLPYVAWTATQDYIFSPKLYILATGALIILAASAVAIFAHRRITVSSSPTDIVLVTLLLAMTALTILVPTNKVQAVLNPNTGLVWWIGICVLYSVCAALRFRPLSIAFFTGGVASLFVTMQSLFPLTASSLPKQLAFLAIPGGTIIGTYLEASFFFGFLTLFGLTTLWRTKKQHKSLSLVTVGITLLLFIATIATGYRTAHTPIVLPSYTTSWLSAVETLQSPSQMLTGFGADNFIVAFTKSKPSSYNSGSDWNQNYRLGRSGLLHLWTEYGVGVLLLVIGLLTTALMAIRRHAKTHHPEATELGILLGGIVVLLVLFPLSPLVVFLMILTLAEIVVSTTSSESRLQVSFHHFPAATIPLTAIMLLLGGFGSYGLYRVVGAELAFKNAIDNVSKGSVVYQQHRRAIQLNPFIERYRVSFSQVNLLLANSIVKKEKPTDQDKQTASQAIQAAIGEAKAAVTLNPSKSGNWLALASTYRAVIPVAKGSDAWAIAAYQRAIVLDPRNPALRLQLGGVYYGLKQYDRAQELFKEAVSLKPDNPNFQYNLAWALYQDKKYDVAIGTMQNVMKLMKNKDGGDYKKAEKELEEFKKVAAENKGPLPQKPQGENPTDSSQSGLTLPQAQPTVSPQIVLPTGAGIATNSAK